MMAEMAAAYCGEKHVQDFLERVGTTYPNPRVVETARRKFWYKADLDKAMGIGLEEIGSGIGLKFRERLRMKRNSDSDS